MRFDEYSKDRLKARSAAMEVESREKTLSVKDLGDIALLIPVNTVAIGCHHHICRSKTKGRNDLFKMILKWLGRFYVEIRVPMEGGKITVLSKIRVRTNRFLRNLFKQKE